MKKRLSLMLLCMVAAITAWAQTVITGTVVSAADGEPLIGASVKVKGEKVAAVTDLNGKFRISAEAGKTLVFSYIAMETVERAAKNGMHVEMNPLEEVMDEVMVVAYGTAKRSSFTGSATIVDNSKIESLSSTNALDALNGNVAGVEIFNATGDPANSNPSIQIRGITSIYAGANPLIVLDGAPYYGDMNTINNNDIESMTVLKDAQANALYGSRAAHGVIVITTKKGRIGNAKVTLDANWGSNSRAQKQYKTISNPAQYYETYYQTIKNYAVNRMNMDPVAANVYANNNLTGNGGMGLGMNVFTVPEGQYMIGIDGKMNPNATLGLKVGSGAEGFYLTPDDWMDLVYSNSLRQEYNVSVSSANDKSNLFVSAGYLNNEGITVNSGFEKIQARLKGDIQAKPWLKVGANMAFTHYDAKQVGEDGVSNSSANPFAIASRVAPIYPMYIRDADGNIKNDDNGFQMYDWGDGKNAGYMRPYLSKSNAIQGAILDENSYEGNSFFASGFAEIRFLKDFTFSSVNTINFDETRSTSVQNGYYGNYASSNGIVGKGHSRNLDYSLLQQLNWAHKFGRHNVDVMLGHEYNKRTSYSLSAYKNNMFNPDNNELNGAVTDQSNSGSSRSMYNTEGIFVRAQYDFNYKYFASASYRRDASSRFSKEDGRWWGNFLSGGVAWVLTQENFMKNIKWLDMLKFKASYGEVGNDAIGNYRYINTYVINNSNGNPAATPSTMGNKDIRWEKNGNFNTGFDFDMFGRRLTGSIEYFYRNTSDMLYWFTTPTSFGWTGYYANVGDMMNQGVEVTLDGKIFDTHDFKWSLGLNLTHYANEVTFLPEERKTKTAIDMNGNEYNGFNSGNSFVGEGLNVNTYYMPVYAGVYGENTYHLTGDKAYDKSKGGKAMWYKAEFDSQDKWVRNMATTNYSEATEYVQDNTTPAFYGGFNTRLEYKGFDLALDFSYQVGGKCYDGTYASFMSNPTTNSKGYNFHSDLLNAWTPDNQASNIPALEFGEQYAGSTSSRFLTNASYLSLNNITLGYSLPKKWMTKAKMDNARIFVKANNVFVVSARQGLDPRVARGGGNTTNYSPIRTISAGVNVTF